MSYKFFKKEWKNTKKAIRKQLLWTKPEKNKLKADKNFKKERNLNDFDNNIEEKPVENNVEEIKEENNEANED